VVTIENQNQNNSDQDSRFALSEHFLVSLLFYLLSIYLFYLLLIYHVFISYFYLHFNFISVLQECMTYHRNELTAISQSDDMSSRSLACIVDSSHWVSLNAGSCGSCVLTNWQADDTVGMITDSIISSSEVCQQIHKHKRCSVTAADICILALCECKSFQF